MGGITEENKLVIITEPKTISFDFLKKFDNNLKHKIDYITKQDEYLVENAIKITLADYFSNITMGIIFMNLENIETKELHNFFRANRRD